MKNNFKRNLLIGFSASLIILIISSAASFISITNLLNSAQLVNHTNDVIISVNEVRSALVDAETGQRGYLLTGREEFLIPYNDAHERSLEAFDRTKSLTSDNSIQQDLLQDLSKLMEERFGYLEIGIQLKQQGQEIEASHLQKGREIMSNVRGLIDVFERNEKTLLANRTENMDRFASYTPPLIISAAMIALLITVMFYVRVQSDFAERMKLQLALQKKDEEISSRINIIQGIADKVSQGSYDIRVNDQESDALGNVAGSLNKMAESLQYSFGLLSDKEWLQTGIAKLNDVMIGDKDIEPLCAQVIEFLASYTHSSAGAIYILEQNELRAAGGYSYVAGKDRQRIRFNEGVVGQCIVSGKPMELKDIPSDSISISFATGEVRPRHVVAVPIYDGHKLKGAVELATISAFTKQHMEFLGASAPNIGIAISTAQNRRRLQELLEETQAQSEELKAQHSELENLTASLKYRLKSCRLQRRN